MTEYTPNIQTFAVLSAVDNTIGNNLLLSITENERRTIKLSSQLSDRYYVFKLVNNKQFFVPNIARSEAMAFGVEWNQTKIFFAEKTEDIKDSKIYEGMKIEVKNPFHFEYQVGDMRCLFVNKEDKTDKYVKTNCEPFVVPYYDSVANGVFENSLEDTYWVEKYSEKEVETINFHIKESLDETKTRKYRFHHRGMITNLIQPKWMRT